MFWLPALSGQPNTDGLNIYLDGTLALPPPEAEGGAEGARPADHAQRASSDRSSAFAAGPACHACMSRNAPCYGGGCIHRSCPACATVSWAQCSRSLCCTDMSRATQWPMPLPTHSGTRRHNSVEVPARLPPHLQASTVRSSLSPPRSASHGGGRAHAPASTAVHGPG